MLRNENTLRNKTKTHTKNNKCPQKTGQSIRCEQSAIFAWAGNGSDSDGRANVTGYWDADYWMSVNIVVHNNCPREPRLLNCLIFLKYRCLFFHWVSLRFAQFVRIGWKVTTSSNFCVLSAFYACLLAFRSRRMIISVNPSNFFFSQPGSDLAWL